MARIADACQLVADTPTNAGFLVSAYAREDYAAFLPKAAMFTCVSLHGRMLGFVMVMPAASLPLSDGSRTSALRFDEPDYVVKQVAVDPTFRRARVGTVLYRALVNRFADCYIGATVMHEPRNDASMRFHEAFGFAHVTDMPAAGGGRSGYWIRTPDSKTDVALLAAQYEQAVELYRHEDSLTWSKLQAVLFISGGVATALGLSVRTAGVAQGDLILRAAVAGIAAIACWALTVSIHSGTRYLAARKQAVVVIEQRLSRFGGEHVVHQPNSRMLRASPTRHVLRALPLVMASAWTAFCTLLLVDVWL